MAFDNVIKPATQIGRMRIVIEATTDETTAFGFVPLLDEDGKQVKLWQGDVLNELTEEERTTARTMIQALRTRAQAAMLGEG